MLLNADRFRRVANDKGLDALIATAPENVTYASGYWALSQWIRRGPQTYVVLHPDALEASEIIAATSLLDLLADDDDIWIRNIRRFGFFQADRAATLTSPEDLRQQALYDLPAHDTAMAALAAAITGGGLSAGRIGIDELGLLPGMTETLAGMFPRAEFVPASEIFRLIRAVKTAPEIERLAHVAYLAERSVAAALAVARPGISEREMARAFHARTVEDDATPILGCIGFGSRGAMPNVQPSDRQLQPGEVIRFDVGGRYRHYRADIARNAVLGAPCQRTRDYHAALHEGVQVALAEARPGMRAAELFDLTMAAVRGAGIPDYARSHVGHGIGIDGYDLPILSPDSPDVLEEDMVLCVETPYYELGWCGLQVEDMVVLRRDGVENLMRTDGTLQVLQ